MHLRNSIIILVCTQRPYFYKFSGLKILTQRWAPKWSHLPHTVPGGIAVLFLWIIRAVFRHFIFSVTLNPNSMGKHRVKESHGGRDKRYPSGRGTYSVNRLPSNLRGQYQPQHKSKEGSRLSQKTGREDLAKVQAKPLAAHLTIGRHWALCDSVSPSI